MCAYDDSHNREIANLTPWRAKIDYLSVTSGEFHVVAPPETDRALLACREAPVACAQAGMVPFCVSDAPPFSPSSGRSGYERSAYNSLGARYFAGHATAKPLFELGGAACDALRLHDCLMPLIQRNFETITRLDLAADLETGVTPAEFVAAGYSARIRTSGADDSETGSTRYVGSEKSAKFARVYRYYDPHPRSKFLRVEVVLRDEYAKSAAQMLLTQSVAEVYWASTASLSFKHPTWRRPDEFAEAKLTLPNERKNANRLRWLEKQIRPVIVEAHKTGLIDVLDWLGLRQ